MTISRPQPTITITRRAEATWLGIDSRRALSGRDQALVTRLAEALQAGDRLQLELPALLHLMRDHQAGQPRAQSLTPNGGGGSDREPEQWELDDPATGHHDPTGDAGISPDLAAHHQREIRRHIEAAITALDQAIAIGNQYPSQAMTLEDIEPTPGDDWCRSCWKDRKYCQPITTRPDGSPYYRGLCKWCGQMTKVLGGEPPTEMVAKRHRGELITDTYVAQVKATIQATKKRKGKSRGRAK